MLSILTDTPAADSPEPVHSAKLEFQASLQLLAERAVFLTGAAGAAIALEENRSMIFAAAAGEWIPEPGTEADLSRPPVHRCIEEKAPVLTRPEGRQTNYGLFVPLVRSEKAIGFIELASQYEFQVQDVEAVTRIADLANVALEHCEAAEQTRERISERHTQVRASLIPSSWHAPDSVAEELHFGDAETPAAPVLSNARACKSCGFPVSPGRVLCVECELKPDAVPAVAEELFAMPTEESWLSAHGYTIASILVPILAAAIIYWLRR